jgi:hypothetical protein
MGEFLQQNLKARIPARGTTIRRAASSTLDSAPLEQLGEDGVRGFRRLDFSANILVAAAHEPGVNLDARPRRRTAAGIPSTPPAVRAIPTSAGMLLGLEIVLHLQAMLDGAEEAVGRGERAGLFIAEQLVLRHLLQQRETLWAPCRNGIRPAFRIWAVCTDELEFRGCRRGPRFTSRSSSPLRITSFSRRVFIAADFLERPTR